MIGFLFALALHLKSRKTEDRVNLHYVQVVYYHLGRAPRKVLAAMLQLILIAISIFFVDIPHYTSINKSHSFYHCMFTCTWVDVFTSMIHIKTFVWNSASFFLVLRENYVQYPLNKTL